MAELVIKRARLIASLFCCVPFIVPPGDYLVTIEEKNNATYLRAYTNWRYQVHMAQACKVSQVLHLIVFVNKHIHFSSSASSYLILIPILESLSFVLFFL